MSVPIHFRLIAQPYMGVLEITIQQQNVQTKKSVVCTLSSFNERQSSTCGIQALAKKKQKLLDDRDARKGWSLLRKVKLCYIF